MKNETPIGSSLKGIYNYNLGELSSLRVWSLMLTGLEKMSDYIITMMGADTMVLQECWTIV
jgi:hypothetical protein